MTRPSHPPLAAIVRQLRQMADRLDDSGDKAIRRAEVLAARGWPTATLGADGSRSSDATSSTERCAIRGAPLEPNGKWQPGPFDDIDNRIAAQLSNLMTGIVLLHANLDIVMSQASDDDPVPPGTGKCLRCDQFVRPTPRRPEYRIRSGFCPACYRKWLRLGKPERSSFIRTTDEVPVA